MSVALPLTARSLQAGRIEFAAPDKDDPDQRVRVVSAPLPFAESDDLEAIEEKAYAHLGRVPDDTVYLIDGDRRLVRSLSIDNRKSHESIERLARWLAIGWVLLFFCVILFAVTAIAGLPAWPGLISFAIVGSFYLGLVLLRIQNEVEAAFLCFIILVLILLLVPAVRGGRERAEANQNKQTQCFPTPPCWEISTRNAILKAVVDADSLEGYCTVPNC